MISLLRPTRWRNATAPERGLWHFRWTRQHLASDGIVGSGQSRLNRRQPFSAPVNRHSRESGNPRFPGGMDFPKPGSMDSRFRGNDGYGTALILLMSESSAKHSCGKPVIPTANPSFQRQTRHSSGKPVIPAANPSFQRQTCHSSGKPVIPAKAGIQRASSYRANTGAFALDSCLRRNDGWFSNSFTHH